MTALINILFLRFHPPKKGPTQWYSSWPVQKLKSNFWGYIASLSWALIPGNELWVLDVVCLPEAGPLSAHDPSSCDQVHDGHHVELSQTGITLVGQKGLLFWPLIYGPQPWLVEGLYSSSRYKLFAKHPCVFSNISDLFILITYMHT